MDYQLIQQEVSKVKEASFAHKTDLQLLSYEILSEMYKGKNKGTQPTALKHYNKPSNRVCKLTIDQAQTIRSMYIPHVYGKERLAKEFGVSTSVIYRIIKGKSWKNYEDSG